MKNKLFLIVMQMLFLFCFQLQLKAQPPLDQDDQIAQEDDPCKDASFTVTYNNQSNNVINLDCPQHTNIILNIVNNNDWRCSFDSGCEYKYSIYANNRVIYHGTLSSSDISRYTIDPQLVAANATNKETTLRVEIKKICVVSAMVGTTVTTVVENEIITIQTIRSGQVYKKISNTGQLAVERICEENPGPGEVICCNPNETWSIKLKNITAVETAIEGQFKINAAVSYNGIKTSNGNFQFSGLLEGNIKKSIKWTNATEIESTFSMQGEKGYCVGPGIQVTYAVYLQEYFIADCDNDQHNDVKQDYTDILYEDGHPSIIKCYYEPFNACQDPLPQFEHKGGGRLFASSDCTGSIYITSLGTGIEESSVAILWKNNETGQSYTSTHLENVPFGNYTLTIVNECCETFTYHRFLCSNAQLASAWQYNHTSGQWCAEFDCGDPTKRSLCQTTKCVEPDRIDIFYQDGKCRERHFYMGEELGIAEVNDKDAIKETEYDDFYDECVYKYYCEGNAAPEAIITQEPDIEEWIFDEDDEKCHLNVICDGQLFEDVDDIDPEVEWNWDDFFNECYTTFILCNGNEVEGEIITEPYNIGEWDDLLLPSYCFREIECIDGGEIFEDQGELDAEEDGQDQDCNGDYAYYKIYCDGEFVKRICNEGDPEYQQLQLNNRSSKDVTILYYNKSLFIKKHNIDIHYDIEIIDVLSKIIIKKSCENHEEIKIDMSSFPDGFYFVRLTKDEKTIAGKKIIVYQ